MAKYVGLMTLLSVLIAGSGCASKRVTTRPLPDRSTMSPPTAISLMTANLHRNTRHGDMRLLADNIRADLGGKPDFILCQEVMFSPLGPAQSSAGVFAKRLGYAWRGNPRGIGSMEGSAI